MSRKRLRYVTKRDNQREPFDALKIKRAIRKAMHAVQGSDHPNLASTLFTAEVVKELNSRDGISEAPHVETVQDVICDVLHGDMARGSESLSPKPESLWMAYMLYREGHCLVRNGYLEPEHFNPDTRPIGKIEDLRRWNVLHDCHTTEGLNRWLSGGRLGELIDLAEKRSDEELLPVVAQLDKALRGGGLRAVLMTGPSSSGKTVTTRRAVRLLSELHPRLTFKPLEVDMYFIDNSRSEALYYDIDGERVKDINFELPETYDLDLLNEHLAALLRGETVQVPLYSFEQGKRIGTGHPLSLGRDEVLLIDCMHALYPSLTEAIPADRKLKIFIEPLSVLEDEKGNPVHLTDVRLMRRLIRDVRTRGYPMATTLWHWHLVRKGERFILPYVHSADIVVDSGLPYEIPVLKLFLEKEIRILLPLFERNQDLFDGRERARRILRLFSRMGSASEAQAGLIPGDSILREFIGGSVFFEE